MAKLRIKARAIDMLGRQQIAGIPTAIHELFKNAHDAYADNVIVDYFRGDDLFVLRDDGIGMTEDDFVQRWLTIGTDSKVSSGTLPPPAPAEGKTPRPVLGEKGIGRLAIATIGPLVLILTRSRKAPPGIGVVASLVHWGFFQIPGLDVDRIDVPVIPLRSDESPGSVLIDLLKEQVIANADALEDAAPATALDRIREDVRSFDVDLPAFYDAVGGPRLDGEAGQGTHFLVLPADRILASDIDAVGVYAASSLTKALLGFSNTMLPEAEKPPITASFRDHRPNEEAHELIGGNSFFTPEDYRQADHHVSGTFDEIGNFRGTIQVYGHPPIQYEVASPIAGGRITECGPFKLDFAYVQGAARESSLDPDAWAAIMEKLNRIGGIYLYRDGVRILPYGNSDYDFLDVERRRTKSASYYFFSYRRLFGAIQTTRAENGGLVEKAGREGFQENRAYRQFKQILENLLVQMAADVFREEGEHADQYLKTKAEIERNELIRRKRERQSKTLRADLAVKLDEFFDKVARGLPALEARDLESVAEQAIRAAATAQDVEVAAKNLIRVVQQQRISIRDAQQKLRVKKPQALGLTKALSRDYELYRGQAAQLDAEVFAPLAMHVERVLGEVVEEFNIPLDARARLDAALAEAKQTGERELATASTYAVDAAQSAMLAVADHARRATDVLTTVLAGLTKQVEETKTSSMSETDLANFVARIRDQAQNVVEAEMAVLAGIKERAALIMSPANADVGTPEELAAAMEERIESLRDEIELYVELAQLGMAIGVVQHDFRDAITTIRASIRALGPWAKANKDMAKLYTSLRTAFEHLDGYLALFAPLNRRLYRKEVTIQGEVIARFVEGVFAERLQGSDIQIVATDAFRRYEVEAYPSTLMPVFINLVENARYWVEEQGKKPGRITLDADGRDLLVSDAGPGVPERDRTAIFDYGFTRKKAGGQGLGLFISRQVLTRAGWQLKLDPRKEGAGATFRLVPPADGGSAEEVAEDDS